MDLTNEEKKDIDSIMDEVNQWSIKLDNGEIFMIRRPTIDELLLARAEYKKTIDRFEITDKPINEELEGPKEGEEPYLVLEVKKEGPNKGRHFKTGITSKEFLGWTDEPLSKRT